MGGIVSWLNKYGSPLLLITILVPVSDFARPVPKRDPFRGAHLAHFETILTQCSLTISTFSGEVSYGRARVPPRQTMSRPAVSRTTGQKTYPLPVSRIGVVSPPMMHA
ncbi:MAG: hypothetical protein A2V98_14920 [Planctomycetes bacterium RBG_16_64_12]|nr:MAG: hypothetical protein A2V98_14920 [Planctomycetes bacterium RBG_16_64_12]